MIQDWMIDDIQHERKMLMWFMQDKRCRPIQRSLLQVLNDVMFWLQTPTIESYPYLCSQTAEWSDEAWAHIHGYLPPRDDKRGAA